MPSCRMDGWMEVGRYVVFRTTKTKSEQMIKSRGE